ncbi:MAG: hypothetical protein ACOYL6_11920 [Bacteriovoracaceae bacterium]
MSLTNKILLLLITLLFLSMKPADFGLKGPNEGQFLSSVSSGIVV